MDRTEALAKVRTLRNVTGREPAEAQAFLAKATELMARYGISEAEVSSTLFVPRPAARTEHEEFMERMRREAANARYWADMARRASSYSPPPPPRAARKAPDRGAFKGTVPPGRVHPNRWQALMDELGLRTKGDLARACGVSSSLVSEWFGKGRGRLASTFDFDFYGGKARRAAK